MTILAMTKIPTRDLAAQTDFYKVVAGFEVAQTIEAPGFVENIMVSPDGGGAALVLMHQDGVVPASGGTQLVFETEDIGAFAIRVTESGGQMTHPIETVPNLGLSYAFFQDPEGNMLEAITRNNKSSARADH